MGRTSKLQSALQTAVCCLDTAETTPDVVVATKQNGLVFCTTFGHPTACATPRAIHFSQVYEEVCLVSVLLCSLLEAQPVGMAAGCACRALRLDNPLNECSVRFSPGTRREGWTWSSAAAYCARSSSITDFQDLIVCWV
jgi:hypothetical protein